MSDDPYRRRCACGALTSKDRFGEGKPNMCFMCSIGYPPPGSTPIAPHRYRGTAGGKTELMREEEES